MKVTRRHVLAFRLQRHGLAGEGSADLLDYGVQDTGHDGAGWALAVRGAPVLPERRALMAWTLRGAPHLYRRKDAADVALATAPWSEADAAKRIFDAAKPLKDAGLAVLDALATVAETMRAIVTEPMPKGEMSRALSAELPKPFLRRCVPCDAIHTYEQPFRLAALQAGLELVPGTSPPVLRRIEGFDPLDFRRPGTEAKARFDVLRNHLRFYGPIDVKPAATFIDAPQKDVKAHWPEDVVPVEVEGESGKRSILADDEASLAGAGDLPAGVSLLAPFDPYLQLRDRELLVPDEAARKDLWRVIGRPGGLLVDGEVVGSWRPRTTGKRFELAVTPWAKVTKAAERRTVAAAEQLAQHRGLELTEVSWVR
jgi:hypothetical protein